ncbi:MAG: helix-hairpin-helix domain-containing protein [Thermodesulfobacteriota bacterium]
MPYFSRAQQGIILLLGAALLLLWAWRANFGQPPSPLPPASVNPVFVEVGGAVSRPGVYAFASPPTLPDVWRQAGGPGPPPPGAGSIPSGSRIEFAQAGQYQLDRMRGAQLLTLGLALELNQATKEDLEALPGIGPALAGRIVEYRRTRGPFRKIEDLERVSGIGPKKLEKVKPYLSIGE